MPDLVNVCKAHAGTDSAGHTWPTDGAVIKVPVEHALVLARIPDGGFTIIENANPETTKIVGNAESAEPAEKAAKPSAAGAARAKPEGKASAK
ncbi:hypothetical protein GCM10009839_14040 [Catenulispora yoronensis]|uniref:Uncharacterized protein n=1 Tax=Catenulispora yoronensis TaxID=450799 RepID=A0ABN2TSZ7_9ACTN